MLCVQRKTQCTCCACCAKHVMMTCQQFPRIQYVTCVVQGSVICVHWSVIHCQEWGCTWLLVGNLGHTGLVPFVHELGTVYGEVPLEYGFEVFV